MVFNYTVWRKYWAYWVYPEGQSIYNWQSAGHITPVKDTLSRATYYRREDVEKLMRPSRFEGLEQNESQLPT